MGCCFRVRYQGVSWWGGGFISVGIYDIFLSAPMYKRGYFTPSRGALIICVRDTWLVFLPMCIFLAAEAPVVSLRHAPPIDISLNIATCHTLAFRVAIMFRNYTGFFFATGVIRIYRFLGHFLLGVSTISIFLSHMCENCVTFHLKWAPYLYGFWYLLGSLIRGVCY